MKQLLVKVKEESAKVLELANEHQEDKVMITDELYNFSIDEEEIEKGILYILVQSSVQRETACKKFEED